MVEYGRRDTVRIRDIDPRRCVKPEIFLEILALARTFHARQNPFDIGVEDRFGDIERDGQDGPGGVRPDPGEIEQFLACRLFARA